MFHSVSVICIGSMVVEQLALSPDSKKVLGLNFPGVFVLLERFGFSGFLPQPECVLVRLICDYEFALGAGVETYMNKKRLKWLAWVEKCSYKCQSIFKCMNN